LRLGRYFGTSAHGWLNLQMNYDLEIASREVLKRSNIFALARSEDQFIGGSDCFPDMEK